MEIELIDNLVRLRAFYPAWAHFLETCPPRTPFQTPEWLMTWWSHFGSGELHFLVFHHAGETVGIFPCFLHPWNGRRQLTLLGAGLSDYLDPAFDVRYSPGILRELERHLACVDWERCDWQDLSADTPLQQFGGVAPDTCCTQISFSTSFESYLSGRPKDLRRNLRRYKEKALSQGTLRFDVSTTTDPALLTALIDLHGARWRRSGETGVIESNRAAGFLRDVAAALAPKDMLRIFTLFFNERIVAIVLALRTPKTLFSYLSAFDPELESFGFGRELLAQAIHYAHREGYSAWNFLRGEEPYKFSWGAQLIPKCRLVLDYSGADGRIQPLRSQSLTGSPSA